MFQVMLTNEKQLPRHCEKRATWVVGLTSWNSRLGMHIVEITHLDQMCGERKDGLLMMPSRYSNHLWVIVIDSDEQIAGGLQGSIASILHVDHPLVGSVEGQGTRENRQG